MANLLEIADRHGIEQLCLFFNSNWSKTPTREELKAAIQEWSQTISEFLTHSPHHRDS